MTGRHTDLTGMRFGRLTVVAYDGHRGKRNYWTCACDCGGTAVTSSGSLMQGHSQSCGCLRHAPRPNKCKRLEHDGESLTYDEWADRLGMNRDTIRTYVRSGIPLGHLVENEGHVRMGRSGFPPRVYYHGDVG